MKYRFMILHLYERIKMRFIVFLFFHKYIFHKIRKSKNGKYIKLRILKYTKLQNTFL